MVHDASRGHNHQGCRVILHDEKAALAAMSDVQGASLFRSRIVIRLQTQSLSPLKSTHAALAWGWLASQDSAPGRAQVRGLMTAPPADLFATLREQRRLVF